MDFFCFVFFFQIKDKNEPARFLGDGVSFKAKLIGILEVNEARGDRMCQEALADLKMAIRAAGEHKQRININIAIDGLRLRDEKTGDCLYHHPVHKISFIAQDMSDSRAFGYIFGSPDTGHRFFGIKTDKAASQVVITMRDLFQVVFELKKKEIEMAKQHIEQHQIKYNSPLFSESSNKASAEPVKIRPIAEDSRKECSSGTGDSEEHNIMDLLDLELELNNIQQGINQMDRITPSDPFGPSRHQQHQQSTSTSSNIGLTSGITAGVSSSIASNITSANVNSSTAAGLSSVSDPFGDSFTVGVGGVPSSSASKLPPPPESSRKTRQSDVTRQWMDNEPLFDQTEIPQNFPLVNIPPENNTIIDDPLNKKESDAIRDQFDVFTDLDPLGTGRSKPYVDKKDFFQDLKNPPKKVLKDLVTEISSIETKISATDEENTFIKENITTNQNKNLYQTLFSNDPFQEDPFCEVDFTKNIGVFTPVSNGTDPFDKFEKFANFETSFINENDKSGGDKPAPLRVSLPPEKLGTLEGSPLSRRKLQRGHSVLKPPSPKQKPRKTLSEDRSDFTEISSSIRLRPAYTTSTQEPYLPAEPPAPDPPPRISMLSGTSLKPPPLPPKKVAIMSTSLFRDSRHTQPDYDYIENYESRSIIHSSAGDGQSSSMISPPLPVPARKPKKFDTEYYLQPFPLLPPPKKKISKDRNQTIQENDIIPSAVSQTPKLQPEVPQSSQQIVQPQLGTVTPNKSLDITLSQLTKSGFSELAASLNMSPTSLSKMTLQELTKCLATISSTSAANEQKDLNDDKNLEENNKITNKTNLIKNSSINDDQENNDIGFKAEFDVHFSSSTSIDSSSNKPQNDQSLFDKYAVFRELLEEERKQNDTQEVQNFNNEISEATVPEDRYAALRDICLDEVTEEKYEELSDKDDSPVDRSRTEEDTDLLPSRPHSQSTDSPTITIKEHQVGINEGTILEEDSVCETVGKDGIIGDEGVFSAEGEENGRRSPSGVINVPHSDTVQNPLPVVSDTSWAKFDCQTETRASSSIHSDGHVSPWSTESKENDLSPCNNTKRRHRKVRNRSGDWDDEESEEWDWRENGWSDADSLYGDSGGNYGNEYWTDERGGTGIPLRIRHRSSPWDSRDASPWEEDTGDWGWHNVPSHSRHGPPIRSQPSWHRPPPIPTPRNHSSSRESLTCDEHHSYQKRSYRRAKWEDDRHRWRDWENKTRYYKDHRDWESEHSDHDRWSRPRSCDRTRRHEDHDRRYSRPRDGHYSDIDRRKVQTMQSQKCRRKQNQTSPFEDDFTSQFTFSKESEPKSGRYESHKRPQFSEYREEKRSYQHSPFEDDFTIERKGAGGSQSTQVVGQVSTTSSGCRSTSETDYRNERERRDRNDITDVPYPRSRQTSGSSSHPGEQEQSSASTGQRRHRQIEHDHQNLSSQTAIRKSESVNIFARNNDPFDDEFFCENTSSGGDKNVPTDTGIWTESFAAFNFDNDHD
ncbi:hypothetical protein O3M35_004579 [Rhynocoris fuscipes]|uniref:PID domain-containing protein n=1 Tax=Rhynocoris fuscipes TaxID=488301 RepID=A0AAW1CG78_9HEMI